MKIHIYKKRITLTLLTFLAPTIVFAQPDNFAEFVDVIVDILNYFIPVIFGIALLAILWAGAQMVLNSDNEQKLREGRTTIFWGVIILVIMVGMWGFVNLIGSTFF